MSLSKQWDVGNSAFSIGEGVLSLVKAATVDNVQPAAVYAAEALGSSMIVSPALIGKAVDILDGNQNVKIHQLKLTIGLSSGGIIGQIRQSSAATRTFLLVTILKLSLNAEEIADILFELLAQSGYLDTLPVSSAQLSALVACMEGHAESFLRKENIPPTIIAPIVEHLATCMDSINTKSFFEPMAPDTMPPIIIHVFRALRNDDLHHLILKGHCSAVWLCSMFYWLCPNNVGIFIGDDLAHGSLSGKVRIYISSGVFGTWSVQEWYQEEAIDCTISQETAGGPYITASTVNHRVLGPLAYHYWKGSGNDIDTAAEMAVAVALLIVEMLTLTYSGKDLNQPVLPIEFRDICRVESLLNLWQFPASYGWPAPVNESLVRELVNDFRYQISRPRHGKGGSPCHDYNTTIASLAVRMGLDQKRSETCFSVGFSMAESFLVGSIVDGLPSQLEVPDLRNTYQRHTGPTSHLWADRTMPVEMFLRWCYSITKPFKALYGRNTLPNESTLVFAAEGNVCFPRILLDFATSRRATLSLQVVPGKLLWRGNTYSELVEDGQARMGPSHPQAGSTIHLDLKDPSLELQLLDSRGMEVKTLLARSSRTLRATWELDDTTGRTTVPQSFHRARMALAMAREAKPDPTANAGTLRELNISEVKKVHPMDWLYPHHLLEEQCDLPFRVVTTLSSSKAASFFAAGLISSKLPLVLQRDTSLLESIVFAERTYGHQWMILSSY